MSKFTEKIQTGKIRYRDLGTQPHSPKQSFAVIAPVKIGHEIGSPKKHSKLHTYTVEHEEQHYYVWVCTRRKVMANNTIKEWGYYICFRYWTPLFPYDHINLYKEVEIEVKHEDGDTATYIGGCGFPNCQLCNPTKTTQPIDSADVPDYRPDDQSVR
jgi:hypothetical protein